MPRNRSEKDLPPTEVALNGTKFWRNAKGQLHREDGPAIEYADGSKAWYQYGRIGRDDGPSFIRADGVKEWWHNGEFIRWELPQDATQSK